MRPARRALGVGGALIVTLSLLACDEAQLEYDSHTMGSNGDAGAVKLRNVLIRPPESGQYGVGANVVVQFTMVNQADRPDALVEVDSPWARDVELYWDHPCGTPIEQVPAVPLPATGPVAADTTVDYGTAYYLRLVELSETVREGTSVPLTFTFDRAGRETLQSIVLAEREALALPPLGCRDRVER